jgi:hypothetical protein
MTGTPWYATREQAMNALDFTESARTRIRVDRALASATDIVRGQLKRDFWPVQATRYWPWPVPGRTSTWRLWLDQDELISLDTLVSGGTTIATGDYLLEPANDGPPYDRIEINLGSDASFESGPLTDQRSIAATGLFGYTDDAADAGTIAEALDDVETGVDVSDSASIGVGDLIKVDNERMVVTGKQLLDTGQTVATGGIDNQRGTTALPVSSGAAFTVDEQIVVDSERMRIADIAGNTLVVERAVNGSVIAAHTATTAVYAYRTLTVTRGVLGTDPAAHNNGSAISRWVPPALVTSYCLAEALNIIEQDPTGWARMAGSGDHQRVMSGATIDRLAKLAKAQHGRAGQMRMRAV